MALSILVVDDNPGVREAICRLVGQNLQYQISGQAENGLVAVQKVAQLRPDIVLLDVRMPEMDGLQAAKRIKAFAPDTVIILLTMYDSEYIRESAAQLGIEKVLLKSGGTNSLMASLANVCGDAPQQGEPD